jgi:predicted RNA-binding protein YlxR (DUF448 family)
MPKKERQKHIPMRMCIVTRKKKPKIELMRLVRVDDKVKVDPKGKERGRGANISMDEKIFDEASKKHLIEKALKLKKKLTEAETRKLRKDFIEAIELRKFRKGSKPVVVRVGKEKFKKVVKGD